MLLVARVHGAEVVSRICTACREYEDAVALALISKVDAERLGLKDGDLVEVSSITSVVTVKVKVSDEVREGQVLMPQSPWSMSLIPSSWASRPYPRLSGLKVTVKRSSGEATSLDKLLHS